MAPDQRIKSRSLCVCCSFSVLCFDIWSSLVYHAHAECAQTPPYPPIEEKLVRSKQLPSPQQLFCACDGGCVFKIISQHMRNCCLPCIQYWTKLVSCILTTKNSSNSL